MSTYVVQRNDAVGDTMDVAWVDVAKVTVPAKTKRKTVIERAAAQTEIEGVVWLRVIPAEHAEPIKVEMEQPPPQLKIG